MKEDLELTVTATSYAGTGASVSLAKTAPKPPAAPTAKPQGGGPNAPASNGYPKNTDGSPDFKKMTPAQKVAYSRSKIKTDLAKTKAL